MAEIAKEVGYSFGMSTNAQTLDKSIYFEKPFDLGRTRINAQIESNLEGFFAKL